MVILGKKCLFCCFSSKKKNVFLRSPDFSGKGNNNTTRDDENQKSKLDFGSKSMNEYLLGSRKMKAFPVAMSLVASYISGVTILGTPSEIYNYGTQYWLIVIPIIFMGITVSTVFLPVFSSLGVGSSYEVMLSVNLTEVFNETTIFLNSIWNFDLTTKLGQLRLLCS